MTLVGEALVDSGPEAESPDLFLIPEQYLDTLSNYIERFDSQFSPSANSAGPIDKEMHPARLGRHRCELVKYRDTDGRLVRSLEIAKENGSTRLVHKATAISITEDEQGKLRGDVEVFCFFEAASKERFILPGHKQPFLLGDIQFLRAATPLIGIKIR